MFYLFFLIDFPAYSNSSLYFPVGSERSKKSVFRQDLVNAMHFKTSITQAAMRHLGGCLPKIQGKFLKNTEAIGTRQI